MADIAEMTFSMPILEIPYNSNDYHELVRLRDLHLRQPIGLRLHDEDRAGEDGHRHFALKDEGGVIAGGLIVVPLAAHSAKLRQMWILPELRGQGHGKHLLETVERALWMDGFRHFTLNARQNATGFYTECGYEVVGSVFVEVGKPHLRMDKYY